MNAIKVRALVADTVNNLCLLAEENVFMEFTNLEDGFGLWFWQVSPDGDDDDGLVTDVADFKYDIFSATNAIGVLNFNPEYK